MRPNRVAFFVLTLTAVAGAAPEPAAKPQAATAEQIEFFETKVRPLLVENCFECHGEKKQKNDLRLDSRAAMLKGTDNGPVIVPGDPAKSRLIEAIHYAGKPKMPPKGKLPDEDIGALTAWIKMGAPWPDAQGVPPVGVAQEREPKKHWAFQPVKKPDLPQVKNQAWVKTPVDQFILSKLEAKEMTPSKPADRRTLIRRATFDLIGLPPTPEEIAAFEADTSPDAFAKVIDRLLALPRYGERWGRHWLDVARYADTKGYVFQEERRYPYAYTYRDYVIRAFNEDLPYDQFIVQQLAADRLPLGHDKGPLAAMGFLTLGRRFLNNQPDIIDDRIDVVSRGLLGLTVSCARCHDHKFDPIPTKDYYSLYGVFAGSVEPKELPLLAQPEKTEAYLAFEKELQSRQQKLAEFLETKREEALARYRADIADYLLAVRDAERLPGEEVYVALAPGDVNATMVRRWQAFLDNNRKQHDPIFAPWHTFAALPQKEFDEKAPALAKRIAANDDPQKRYHPLVAEAFGGKAPESLRNVAGRYGELFAKVDQLWQETLQKAKERKADEPKALLERQQEALRQVLYGRNSPTNPSDQEIDRLLDRKTRDELTPLRRKVDEWQASSPVAPPRAMVLEDSPSPPTPRVFIRGNANNPGDSVPRQFLLILAGNDRKPFPEGSGRLDLARAIASQDNPLTARVLVNRIWLHHFGAGLVRTPSEFGTRGDLPTHPELLDYLASTFVDEGWSIKKMHRLIMLSNAYQQRSNDDREYARLDPDNRLLWRQNRQRLDFEQLRDALLMVAGRLDLTLGGPAVDLTKAPFTTRRTVYGFIDRQNLPGLFRTFDFASPDSSSPQRHATTVPQQALFLMNSPFVIEQARAFVKRPEVASAKEPEQRIEQMYRLAYGRAPEPEEVALGLRFLKAAHGQEKADPEALSPWEKYAQMLLLANEFVFVD